MNRVFFVPKAIALKITQPVNMISICGAYDSHPDFKQSHNLLRLQFFNIYHDMPETAKRHLISDDNIQAVMDYVVSAFAKGEDIFVHCGEGSIRSPAIAYFISYLADYEDKSYMPSGTYGNHTGTDHHMCRWTLNRCMEFHAKKVTEGKVRINQDQVRAKIEAAGLAYSAVYSMLDSYKIDGERLFLETEVDEAIKKTVDAAAALSAGGSA